VHSVIIQLLLSFYLNFFWFGRQNC